MVSTRPRRTEGKREIARGSRDPFARTLHDYVHNLVVGSSVLTSGQRGVRDLDDATLLVELAHTMPETVRDARARKVASEPARRLDAEEVRACLRAYAKKHGRALREVAEPAGSVGKNLRSLARLCALDEGALKTLTFVLCLRNHMELEEVTDQFSRLALPGAVRVIATATAQDPQLVLQSLQKSGSLVRSGLVRVSDDLDTLELKLRTRQGLLDLILGPPLERSALLERFLPLAPAPTLSEADFAELGPELRTGQQLLSRALETRATGVNILLHGPTGTGKTELARLLAKTTGSPLYLAGSDDDAGGDPDAHERLGSLMLGNQLLAEAQAVLLLDELEDLFQWAWSLFGRTASSKASKVWMNSLLESNPVPTIWITNQIAGIDPAYLRRFAYVIEVAPAGARARARVLARHLGSASALSSDEVAQVAERFVDASPAELGTAVRVARLLAPDGRPDRGTIESVLTPTAKMLTGADPLSRPVFESTGYCLEAVNASENLEELGARLASWKPGVGPGVSLCLYGPPGTGKSEFVKYLGHRMGRRVEVHRASDLLSMWVGGTEKAIADAFQGAERDGSLLLLDEVDSFLQDRHNAQRSWEVTQVNELLQQLERFRGVVACTTNLWRGLDEAALRRFVFKVEFRYLQPEQALAVCRRVFAGGLAAPFTAEDETRFMAELGRVRNLALGDVAAVARKLRALGGAVEPARIVQGLKTELAVKRDSPNAIGF